ncbi:SDR family oxidoreductase [Alsobacter sp. SYSU M60028]|uniref:SDR family oxidoreductase n=1 Tax=Alsobacter ponti TaxID=2962936 RepID=A0ABT1L9W5_9HYPH|nr:SDR family oxidoreductase [Alsobacter ponti]
MSAALVTGAAKRIGAAIARRLAAAGYAVAIHCRDSRAEADALAEEIARQGGRAAVVAGDLAEPSACARVVAEAAAALGGLDLLVNNASLFLPDTLADVEPGLWDRHFAVNARAPVLLAQAFAAQAGGRSDPSIVNIVDQRVLRLTPQFFSYTLSKAALHAATVTMAQALAPSVRVNAVGPGPTAANIHDGEEGLAREAAGVPLARAVDPAEIAEAVLYLARARSVTGQLLAVDAGQHIGWRTPDIIET